MSSPMRFRNVRPAAFPAVVAALFVSAQGGPLTPGEWTPVERAPLPRATGKGTVTPIAEAGSTAGMVSPSMAMPEGADALWVECETGMVGARGLTLAALATATGESIGYWQNASPLQAAVRISAVLPLVRPAGEVRLFAGSHGRAALDRFEVTACRPVRTGVAVRNMIYGAAIGPPEGRTPRQVFTATGRELAGVVILVRPVDQREPRPDLRVRLYRWTDALAPTLAADPLAEALLPWQTIAIDWESESVADEQIDATYEGGIRRMAAPLPAATEPGEQYLLELAAVGNSASERAYISFGWEDAYPGGYLFDGTRKTTWDLYFETYDAAW